MSPDERGTCLLEADRARQRVSSFLSAIVTHRKQHFVSVAKRHYPDVYEAVEKSKAALEILPDDTVDSYKDRCLRYEKVSKDLILKVGFLLARSVLP